MKDTYKAKGLRKKLAKSLSKKGIEDFRVLQAFENVPRHFFFDSAFLEQAYEDKAFPIGEGQTISQPYTVAYQTELLKVREGDKVLELGTGSGYQASILLEMGAEVHSIERIRSLHERAKLVLKEMGYRPKLYFGDGTRGLPEHAPFDKILSTAAAPHVPEHLIEQLRMGGILVVPVGSRELQTMYRITRTGDHDFRTEAMDDFRFVPLIGEKGW
ncbi:MAG: protein-L-isoaspartate(D-aspartate) O-methyltransferase [Bacteroidia bacterium]